MNPHTTVRGAMTPTPHTIGADQTLASAHELMRQHGVRHLPVLHGGKLLGIVSQRDLFFVETLKDVDPERVTVEEAMSQEPYVVDAETPLPEVVRVMAQSRYGAALVTEHNKVIGIFTAIDGLHLLATLIEGGVASPP